MTNRIKLEKGERIVAVVPEYAQGPGYANRPLWVHIVKHGTASYRCECIQPEHQTVKMHTLFKTCEAAHTAMLCAVEEALKGRP